MVDLTKIDKKLKEIKMSQSELARQCGVEQSAFNHFLSSGKQFKKHFKLIKKICSIIKIDWKEIIY